MINYSIIIPHKNSQDTLAYCLSTIPIRDDVQVIVVDDNSDPQKVDFENFPQWQGKHYEFYLTKEGKGAGYARNVGLAHAVGKWVLFIDADDFVLPTINAIFDEFVNSDADLIYFRPKAVMLEDRGTPSNRADAYIQLIEEYFKTKEENNIRCRFGVPWSKFVRKSLIDTHKILFEEIPFANDVVFSVLVGCHSVKIQVENQCYYVVTQSNNNSLMSNFLSKPGELSVRTSAFFRAQRIIYSNGWRVDFDKMINYLRILFSKSQKDFFICFKLVQLMEYGRVVIIRKLFEKNSWHVRVKRGAFVFLKTL